MDNSNPIIEIEKMLKSLEKLDELAQRKLLRQEDVRNLLNGFDDKVLSFFDYDSIPYRIYESGTKGKTLTWCESFSKLADKDDHNKLLERIELLKNAINELEPDFLKENGNEQNEYYFHKGETYKSKKILFFLMMKANKSLIIIDQYLDETILPFIDSLDDKIEIKLLTSKKRSIFVSLYNDLIKIKKNIEAKLNTDCHNRYIIIDENEIWDLGTSINGYGKSAFTLKRKTDNEQIQKLLSDCSKWWSIGQEFIETA